jgi:hypothetical protein
VHTNANYSVIDDGARSLPTPNLTLTDLLKWLDRRIGSMAGT